MTSATQVSKHDASFAFTGQENLTPTSVDRGRALAESQRLPHPRHRRLEGPEPKVRPASLQRLSSHPGRSVPPGHVADLRGTVDIRQMLCGATE